MLAFLMKSRGGLRKDPARSAARRFGQCGGALLMCFGALSCGGDPNTSARRIELRTQSVLAPSSRSGFETALGWHVRLQRALIATGPLYFFEGRPGLLSRSPASSWPRLRRWFSIPTAHAHPGHYQSGDALGQVLQPSSLDLLAGDGQLPRGEGVTGPYRSAQFSFQSGFGPYGELLGNHVALVEGSAEKPGHQTRYFRAAAELADIERSVPAGVVEGCSFETANVTGNGTVTVRVDPGVWFAIVDFEQQPPGSQEEPSEFAAESQAQLAFSQGLAQLTAYAFSFTPELPQ